MDGDDMIKRSTDSTEIATWVCDHCTKEMPGLPIRVYYPKEHINDSDSGGASHFCSDRCLIEFEQKLTKKYGFWKSTPVEEKVQASEEDMRAYTRTRKVESQSKPPKAYRSNRKPMKKPNAPEEA